ncbi:hypothetical protein Gogos_020329, partial [Gossypium gossypioides]|nr:hypothetical protein [Gossypium gossypioides]
MEGQPWLFRKNLVIFYRLTKPMERNQIRVVSSPFWIKIGSEVNGEFCRLRIKLNVQKPLRRGIFVSVGNENRFWIPFKYEKLSTFCFGCGRLGHGLQESQETLKFNALSKKLQPQCSYTRSIKENQETYSHSEKSSDMIQGVQKDSWLTATGTGIKMQQEGEIDEKKIERSKTDEYILKPVRKSNWKRIKPAGVMKYYGAESKLQKMKLVEIEYDDYGTEEIREDVAKRMRYDRQDLINKAETNLSVGNPNQNRSAAAKSPQAVRRLQFLLKQNNPQMIFFMETKVNERCMEKIRRRCGFMNGFDVR